MNAVRTTTRRDFLLRQCAPWLVAATLPARSRAASTLPLRVILPVGPGSTVDAIARAAQKALSAALDGRPVVIENLPGAGGIPGTQALVRAAPDGNTIGFLSNNHAVNPSVYRHMPYDGLRDLTPVSVIGTSPFVLVVNPDKLPVGGARELQAALKAAPERYLFASSGNGTILQLAGEMAFAAMDVRTRHVPYKTVGAMITDLLAGQVDIAVSAVASVAPHLQSGRLRAIGAMGRERIPVLPQLPTFAEQGFGDVDIEGWFAVAAPKGLPVADVQRLHAALVRAFDDPAVRAAMAQQDTRIHPTTPQDAATFMAHEQQRYAALVRRAGVGVD